jgi:signal transduction histidine kinase
MVDQSYEEQLKAANEAVYKHSLELARLKKELEETNARQEGLLHYIGHEVKGFLTKDAGAFAALIDGDFGQLQDGMKPFVENALAQSRDGVRSVTDILTASNQKTGRVSYSKTDFDLKALVQETVEKANKLAEGKGLTLTFSADDAGAPFTINGDKEKIGDNVLRNIVENSIFYTPSGSVSVSLKKENGKCVIAVKDTGVGISDEDMKNLFTEGGHGKESQKINAHSTGYGLFIAKNIVEAHGGTIRAESEGAGKGSTFTIELPA